MYFRSLLSLYFPVNSFWRKLYELRALPILTVRENNRNSRDALNNIQLRYRHISPCGGGGHFLYTSSPGVGDTVTYYHRLVPGACFRRPPIGRCAFYRYGFAIGVCVGRLAVAVVSYLRFFLVSR